MWKKYLIQEEGECPKCAHCRLPIIYKQSDISKDSEGYYINCPKCKRTNYLHHEY